jgi:osmoprotectant transport system ATP-binding protein
MVPNLPTVDFRQGLAEGLGRVLQQGADYALVVDEGRGVMGIVSAERMQQSLGSARTIGEVMVSGVVTVPAKMSVKDAVDLMVEKKVNFLSVVDDESHPLGLITRSSLVDVIAEKFWDRKDLLAIPRDVQEEAIDCRR